MTADLSVALSGGLAAVVLAAGSTVAVAAASGGFGSAGRGYGPMMGQYAERQGPACDVPSLSGRVVDVTVFDRGGMGHGGMMGGGYRSRGMMGGMPGMMGIRISAGTVPAGQVSLRVTNAGQLTHELVVLPLTGSAVGGQRAAGDDGTISESGSLGEASATCAAGEGDGIASGSSGWVTVTLRPGRYELVCNLPGHYASGMYAELDVTG